MEVIHGSTIHSLSNLLLHLTGGKKLGLKTYRNETSHIKNHETNLLYVSISMEKYSKRLHSLASRAAWSTITGGSFHNDGSSLFMQHTWKAGTNKNFVSMAFPSRFGKWAVLGHLNTEQPFCTPSSVRVHRQLEPTWLRWSVG